MTNKTPVLFVKNWPHISKKRVKMKKELNQSELQYLIAINRKGLIVLQDEIQQMKYLAARLWDECNPNDRTTEKYFDELTQVKDWLEEAQRHYRTLSKIQHKLKTMR